jgi:alpha-tubulin suppressor-like RCC1 family protein
MIRTRRRQEQGFALPTILIASVVMLMVLVAAVTSTESVHSALDRQYYDQLAREAAESGLALAQLCLESNSYTPSWTSSFPLRPDKDCTGTGSSGASEWMVSQGNIQTTFSVPAPVNNNVSQLVTATGTVQLLQPSTGQPWRSYTYTSSAQIGVNLNLNTVAFGYSGQGAYFGTVAADGTLRMVGDNTWGQLSNGSTSNTLTPTPYLLNGTDKPASVYTNFVSTGLNTFVITNNGAVWGAGANGNGQLGNGNMTDQHQAVQFNLPGGVTGKSVTIGGLDTYVLGSDNNIYAAGMCSNGLLGYNYTISGCSDQSSYKRVTLPTPVLSNTNTLPTTNISTDYRTVFVRMQGGMVYGWGTDRYGILANGNTTDVSNPIQIGTFGNTSQPTAKQVFTDGDSVWIVGSDGTVWGAGGNSFGELGGIKITVFNANKSVCLNNPFNNGTQLELDPCNGNVSQQFTFEQDGSIYEPNKNVCVNNPNNDGVTLELDICNGNTSQKFVLRDDGSIYDAQVGKCFDNTNADGKSLRLFTCNGTPAQVYSLPVQSHLIQFNLPAGAGNAVKIAGDEKFITVMTANGQVWSAGINSNGQLGNGSTATYQPYPVQFILPNGVTATDIYTTSFQPVGGSSYVDTFVIGSNGRVYGAGANAFGQLGDGTTTDRSTPVAMSVIDGSTIKALQVQSGFGTTVVLTANHKVYTVGNNGDGQLGDGTTNNSSTPAANKYTNVLPVTTF